jgi:hypothetical protein
MVFGSRAGSGETALSRWPLSVAVLAASSLGVVVGAVSLGGSGPALPASTMGVFALFLVCGLTLTAHLLERLLSAS